GAGGRRGRRPRRPARASLGARDRAGAPPSGGEIHHVISTHVLDTEHGRPAAGLRVGLYRGDELVSERETDDDGRIAALAPAALEPGVYRIGFHRGGSFHRADATLPVP